MITIRCLVSSTNASTLASVTASVVELEEPFGVVIEGGGGTAECEAGFCARIYSCKASFSVSNFFIYSCKDATACLLGAATLPSEIR